MTVFMNGLSMVLYSSYAIGGNVATAATLAGVIFMALRF